VRRRWAAQQVGGVPVEVVAAVVITPGRSGIGMAGGVLDVLEGRAGGQGFGDEGVAQAVRGDRRRCLDAGSFGETLEQLVGGDVGQLAGLGAVEEEPACRGGASDR